MSNKGEVRTGRCVWLTKVFLQFLVHCGLRILVRGLSPPRFRPQEWKSLQAQEARRVWGQISRTRGNFPAIGRVRVVKQLRRGGGLEAQSHLWGKRGSGVQAEAQEHQEGQGETQAGVQGVAHETEEDGQRQRQGVEAKGDRGLHTCRSGPLDPLDKNAQSQFYDMFLLKFRSYWFVFTDCNKPGKPSATLPSTIVIIARHISSRNQINIPGPGNWTRIKGFIRLLKTWN